MSYCQCFVKQGIPEPYLSDGVFDIIEEGPDTYIPPVQTTGSVWVVNNTPSPRVVSLWIKRLDGAQDTRFPWMLRKRMQNGAREEFFFPVFAQSEPIVMSLNVGVDQDRVCMFEPVFFNTSTRPYFVRDIITMGTCG